MMILIFSWLASGSVAAVVLFMEFRKHGDITVSDAIQIFGVFSLGMISFVLVFVGGGDYVLLKRKK